MPEPGLAIEARELSKRYEEVPALDGFELAVPYGTVHGLLGPNGAGKTTAVRVLTTLLRADGGRGVRRRRRRRRDPQEVRRRIGLAGQYAAVDEILTGRQNLELFGRALPPRPAPGAACGRPSCWSSSTWPTPADKGVEELQRRHAAPARPGRRA